MTKLLPRGRPALGTLTAGRRHTARARDSGNQLAGTAHQEQPTRNRSPVDAPDSLIAAFNSFD